MKYLFIVFGVLVIGTFICNQANSFNTSNVAAAEEAAPQAPTLAVNTSDQILVLSLADSKTF